MKPANNKFNPFKIIQLIIVTFWLIAFLISFIPSIFPFHPLDITDFVVSKDSEIIIFSHIHKRIFIYSKDFKVRNIFDVPWEKGAKLAIDENNNVYASWMMKYNINGNGYVTPFNSVNRELPRNWKLNKDGMEEQFKEIEGEKELLPEGRLRRIAKPGDILFSQRSGSGTPFNNPFIDNKGNKYICYHWSLGIQIYNPQGVLTDSLMLPFYLRPLVIPFPAYLTHFLFFCSFMIISLMKHSKKNKKSAEVFNLKNS